MNFRRLALSFTVLLAGSSALLQAGAVTFNFDSDTVGTATSFVDTVSGLSATFSSSGDPGGFQVGTTFFSALTGNVLLDPGPAAANNLTLTILFSAPQDSITMDFATNSAPGVEFDLDALSGGSAVGSSSAAGVVPSGFTFPEGTISFDGAVFDEVVLSSDPAALDFAIDNVTVTAAGTPEPGSLSLLGFGLACLVVTMAFARSKSGAQTLP